MKMRQYHFPDRYTLSSEYSFVWRWDNGDGILAEVEVSVIRQKVFPQDLSSPRSLIYLGNEN